MMNSSSFININPVYCRGDFLPAVESDSFGWTLLPAILILILYLRSVYSILLFHLLSLLPCLSGPKQVTTITNIFGCFCCGPIVNHTWTEVIHTMCHCTNYHDTTNQS